MKRLKISPLVTFAMATQMIVSPFAHAENFNALDAINMAGRIIQTNQQNMMAQQNAMANQQMVSQMTAPGRDKYFNTDSLARIPGLMEYMARSGINPATLTCPTLPTTVTEVKAEVCRIGVTNDRGVAPQAQLGEMFSLYKTYGDVAKAYENYRSNSNAEGQGFGVGCMKNALQTLNGFFAYRINELDKLTTNLEALNNQFREASKVDLDAISESTAVLDGNAELLADVTKPNPDLMNYAKRFDNPACKSMYAGDKLDQIGKGRPGGLNQISKNMRDQFAAKPAGSKFSGESYVGAHASVVEDINKLADKAAQQFQLNFTAISSDPRGFGEFAAGIQNSVSSANNLNNLLKGDFFSDAQLSYSKQFEKIAADKSTLENELSAAGVNPQSALRLANNLNATNFESEVGILQNQIRNGCLQRSFGGSGFWDRIKKNIIDPDASKFANRNAFNSIRERIEDIMTNKSTTPEAKITELRRLEQSSGSRFMLNMQGSYQKTVIVNGTPVTTKVNPSSNAPSSYFNDIVQTCDAQFSTNKLGSAMTGAGAIQKLRELNQQYRSLATAQTNNIRQEIRRKLIQCENSNEASNQQAGSCTPERFNTSSSGFCANAAFTCATNMKSCSTQAQNFVTQIKTERKARVDNYKALAQKNKADIVRIFDTALAKYMREGEMMRGLFGAGFSSPTGIKREVAGDKYLSKFRDATTDSPDGPLLLEDPDKYVEMFKSNIALLKNEVQKQQQEIMGNGGRGGLLAQHVEQTDRNYQTAMRKAEEISNMCIAKHDDYVRQAEQLRQQQLAEQQKKMNELGEKRQDFCNRFSMLDTNPNAACAGNIMDAVSGARTVPGGEAQAQVYGQRCARVQSENGSSDGAANNTEMAALNICRRHQGGQPGTPRSTPEGSPSAVTGTGDAALAVYCARISNPEGFCTMTQTGRGDDVSRTYSCSALFQQIYILGGSSTGNQPTEVASSDTVGTPDICTSNGDRNTPEGGSLMGANPAQAIGTVFGI
jgi:hypothetical protein